VGRQNPLKWMVASIPAFNLHWTTLRRQFWFRRVVSKCLNFAATWKDLSAIFVLWFCPTSCYWNVNIHILLDRIFIFVQRSNIISEEQKMIYPIYFQSLMGFLDFGNSFANFLLLISMDLTKFHFQIPLQGTPLILGPSLPFGNVYASDLPASSSTSNMKVHYLPAV
jgi:hypothetical protein